MSKKTIEYKRDIWFIADQISNDEESSDEEMVEHLAEQTSIEKDLLSKIVSTERPKVFKNPLHEIDFTQYGLPNIIR